MYIYMKVYYCLIMYSTVYIIERLLKNVITSVY